MQTVKSDGIETIHRHIRSWLKKNEIPYQRYKNLSNHYKVVLRNLVCTPTHPTTYNQRRELYKRLCLSYIGGRESIDPVDFMPDDELSKFFTPVAPSETLSYLEKF